MDREEEMRTDIALVKKDIQQIYDVFKRLEASISKLTDVLKVIAVQEKMAEISANKIDDLEKRVQHLESTNDGTKDFSKELEKTNVKVTKLEEWKYIVAGGIIVITFLLNKIDLTKLFG